MRRIAFLLCALLWAALAVWASNAFAQAPANLFQQSVVGAGNSGYPPGSTPTANSATGTTAGTSAFLSSSPGQFTYLCGFSVSPGSASTAITLTVTTQNVSPIGTWYVGAPVTAVGVTGNVLTVNFSPCVRSPGSSGPGVNVSALGLAGVNQSVVLWGYMQ